MTEYIKGVIEFLINRLLLLKPLIFSQYIHINIFLNKSMYIIFIYIYIDFNPDIGVLTDAERGVLARERVLGQDFIAYCFLMLKNMTCFSGINS